MAGIRLHNHDLPNLEPYTGKDIALDTETLGLNFHRDRLCLVQISSGDGCADIIRIGPELKKPVNLISLLQNPKTKKIFHYARFDVAIFYHSFGILIEPVFCTKIASRLVRTYTNRHGLKDLCAELLGIDLSKICQLSDWGAETLSPEQLEYAASDVLYLHRLYNILSQRLIRENRMSLAEKCFDFLPTRASLDIAGWQEQDIFAHTQGKS